MAAGEKHFILVTGKLTSPHNDRPIDIFEGSEYTVNDMGITYESKTSEIGEVYSWGDNTSFGKVWAARNLRWK